MTSERVSVVLPVSSEDSHLASWLQELERSLEGLAHEILVCVDSGQPEPPFPSGSPGGGPETVRLVKNDLEPGPSGAIKAGFREARGDVIVTLRPGHSDPSGVVRTMVGKIRVEGADVVTGSRYMRGGSRADGTALGRFLSQAAGVSLYWMAGIGTRDVTTTFCAYRTSFIRTVAAESTVGGEIAAELTVKAHLGGYAVREVPWRQTEPSGPGGRARGAASLPRCLRWYLKAAAAPLVVLGSWAALLLAALVFVWKYAPALPVSDEWTLVPYVTLEKPVTLEWLWSQHHEHRIALPKAIYFFLARGTHLDARPMASANVLLLGAAALALCASVRRLKGRWNCSDAFYPMLLLNWGHWANLCFPFQIALVCPAFLMCVLASALIGNRSRPEHLAAPVGFLLCGLGLCGAVGLPVVALLSPWMLMVAIRSRRWVGALSAAAAGVLVLFYLVGYHQPAKHLPSADPAAVAVSAVKCLSMGFGARVKELWPGSGVAVMLLLGGAAVAWVRRGNRGALLELVALVGLSLLIGYGRAGQSYHEGFVERYALLMAPLLAIVCAGYETLGSRLVPGALACVFMALLIPNADDGLRWMRPVRERGRAVRADLRAGVPISELARRHQAGWDLEGEDFESLLGMLSRAGMSIFRR